MQWYTDIESLITKIGVAAVFFLGLVYVAYAGLKHFGAKYLENHFAKTLQVAQQDFNRQLKESEQKHALLVLSLKSQFDREHARAVRLVDKEFESLTELWSHLQSAYWKARQFTGRGFSYHSFTEMSSSQAAEFIDSLSFPNWQKQALRDEPRVDRRTQTYIKFLVESQVWEGYEDRNKLVQYLDRCSIVIQPDVYAQVDALADLITNALSEYRMYAQAKGQDWPREFTQSERLALAHDKYEQVQRMIRERLWSSLPEAKIEEAPVDPKPQARAVDA